jgi:hypothetical protein
MYPTLTNIRNKRMPGRLRRPKAGLGADPQDAIWNDIFHGNLEAKPAKKFIMPKDTWTEDESKVMILTSSEKPFNVRYPMIDKITTITCSFTNWVMLLQKLEVVSLPFLLNTLPPLERDTIDARNAWLSSKAGSQRVKLIEVKEKVAKQSDKPLSATTSVVKEEQKDTNLDDITNGIESLDIVKENDNDKENDDAPAPVPAPYVNFRSRFLGIPVDRK